MDDYEDAVAYHRDGSVVDPDDEPLGQDVDILVWANAVDADGDDGSNAIAEISN